MCGRRGASPGPRSSRRGSRPRGRAVTRQARRVPTRAVSPDFPEAYREEAREGREALDIWRKEAKGLDWTYLSPAAEIAPGARTGKYRTTDDKLLTDDKGKSFITFEDYAAAVLDELEHPRHVAKRFGVAY